MRELVSYETINISGGRNLTGDEWIAVGVIGLNAALIGSYLSGSVAATILGGGSIGSFILLGYLDII